MTGWEPRRAGEGLASGNVPAPTCAIFVLACPQLVAGLPEGPPRLNGFLSD